MVRGSGPLHDHRRTRHSAEVNSHGVHAMPHEQAEGSAAPHGRRGRRVEEGVRRPAHRPRLGQPARAGPGRRLRQPRCRSTRSARVSVPEPRMFTVQVWDRGVVKAVDKAIREAGLGLNPHDRGPDIRVPIPELNRGAPQGTDQGRRQIRRAGAGRGAQRPARRHGGAASRPRRTTRSPRTSTASRATSPEADRRAHQEDRRDARPEGKEILQV